LIGQRLPNSLLFYLSSLLGSFGSPSTQKLEFVGMAIAYTTNNDAIFNTNLFFLLMPKPPDYITRLSIYGLSDFVKTFFLLTPLNFIKSCNRESG